MEQAIPVATQSIWDERFDDLTAFIKANGHSRVTPRNTESMDLRGWVVLQRMYARLGTLDPFRRERLEQIGFDWEPADQRSRTSGIINKRGCPIAAPVPWEIRLQQLIAFKERTGHTRVPLNGEPDKGLGHWVSTMRAERRRGMVGPDEIRRLDEIGFEWNPRRGGFRAPPAIPQGATQAPPVRL